MNAHLKALASLALASALAAGHAQSTTPGASSTKKKTTTHKRAAKAPAKPSVESQIEDLRRQTQAQIDQLKQQLADRDQQLQQAQQAATAAQAAAQQAQQAAAQQSQTLTENTQAVSNLQGAVSDLKTNTASLTTTIQDEQTRVQREIENPDTIHFKGVTLSPTGSYLAGETVWRQRATGGGINTQFTGIPLNNATLGKYSEFYGSGRQSRAALFATGKASNATLAGYYEADWLGTGISSNNNQSNSYVMRQRQLWGQAGLNSGWTFTGGQMWSLATETTKGLQNRSEILPSTIDPQYTAGFVWARQYAFRVTKNFGTKYFAGLSAENPQILLVGHNNFPNFVIGEPGNNGGLYNLTANYSANVAPDIIAKVAYEPPGWGHYELFGIARFFRSRVYPNATATPPSSVGAYNNTVGGGGVGASARVPTLNKHLDVGLKGLYGDGTGRYGSSTIGDTTFRPNGTLALIHNFSALGTLEFHATPRLDLYANYGADYVGRRYFVQGAGKPQVGWGAYTNVETGCNTEPVPGTAGPTTDPGAYPGYTPGAQANCTADTKDVQEFTAGYWYNFYNGPYGRIRQGAQYAYFQRKIWSGVGPTPSATNNMFWTSFRYYLP